jgi:hypothetical protein
MLAKKRVPARRMRNLGDVLMRGGMEKRCAKLFWRPAFFRGVFATQKRATFW